MCQGRATLQHVQYPGAGRAMQDCSWHGSAQKREEMKKILQEELEEERMVGMILTKRGLHQRVLLVMGPLMPNRGVSRATLWKEPQEANFCWPVRDGEP